MKQCIHAVCKGDHQRVYNTCMYVQSMCVSVYSMYIGLLVQQVLVVLLAHSISTQHSKQALLQLFIVNTLITTLQHMYAQPNNSPPPSAYQELLAFSHENAGAFGYSVDIVVFLHQQRTLALRGLLLQSRAMKEAQSVRSFNSPYCSLRHPNDLCMSHRVHAHTAINGTQSHRVSSLIVFFILFRTVFFFLCDIKNSCRKTTGNVLRGH